MLVQNHKTLEKETVVALKYWVHIDFHTHHLYTSPEGERHESILILA